MAGAVRFTDDDIVRLGLTYLGSAAQFSSLSAPQGAVSKRLALSWNHIRTAELAKRRWVFAYEPEYVLTLVETNTARRLPYRFAVPGDALRLIRQDGARWQQSRTGVWADTPTLTIPAIFDVTSDQFSAAFVEVLAWAVAWREVQVATQSNSKVETVMRGYADAVADAGRQNAFVIGAEPWVEDELDNAVTQAFVSGGGLRG